MSDIAITDARDRLAAVVDQARRSPVFLTRRGTKLVAVVDADFFDELVDAWEELRDIRAIEEADRLGEIPIPWEQAKRELGM
jgi:prevent-host-death family protein